MDSAVVAGRTGAVLVGGESTANVGRGGGLPEDRIRVVGDGEQALYGAFTLDFVVSDHCPPDRFPGTITEPVVPPVKASAYHCGEAWSVLVTHTSGRTALVQGSAGFVAGSLQGRSAEVAYLGVGQLGRPGRELHPDLLGRDRDGGRCETGRPDPLGRLLPAARPAAAGAAVPG